ncbi:uncharacterized protein IWZ02DRAFT_289293 [Phyllosticta citriasiana]|uniref:Uncharacterized protein n=1 Tax=Phyllosticta citriasiana TaxID=595635 RepID=A0ABR1KLD2_9PEZI
MKRRAAIEQLAPVLSTAYNSLLNALDTPRKSLERPWFWRDSDALKKNGYASESESDSDSDSDTVTGETVEEIPPPPTPDSESLRLLLDSSYVQFKHGDTPSSSPLLVVLDIVEIMLAESPSPAAICSQQGKSSDQTAQPRQNNNEKKKSRRSFRRPRPTNNFEPSQAPPLPTTVPDAAETAPVGLSCEQVMQLVDFLMKNWPNVERTIFAMLRDNPGLRLDGCIRLLGQRVLGKVLS